MNDYIDAWKVEALKVKDGVELPFATIVGADTRAEARRAAIKEFEARPGYGSASGVTFYLKFEPNIAIKRSQV